MGLFGKKKPEAAVPQPSPKPSVPRAATTERQTCFIGKNLSINGKLSGSGDVVILGKLEGECDLKGELKVAQPAKIVGQIKADVMFISGQVDGTVQANTKIVLENTARLTGKLQTGTLAVSEGAVLDGEIKMKQ
jgi:cytoskeletal protein CcmA (bactofilin family)